MARSGFDKNAGAGGGGNRQASQTCLIVHPVLLNPPKSHSLKIASGNDAKSSTAASHDRDVHTMMEEIAGLAQAIRLNVLEVIRANIRKISAGHYIGEGTRAAIKEKVAQTNPTVVIVNAALSPVQQRNLEVEWNAKVIDRTGLILEIFGDRAQTAEGKMQVELAALSYQRSRLVRSWTHLERQRGGAGFLGGPGETQIEIDRRIIDDKMAALKIQLDQVRKNRDLQRKSRERVPYPVIALVGYTNAGKSTLFNRLTGAEVFAQDLLFATLDPTMRRLKLPHGREVILSDTVGFISDLPTHLIAAFRATLEQVNYADIILHVRDISSSETESQRNDVITILKELGIEYDQNSKIIEVLNKIDRLDLNTDSWLRDPTLRGRQIPISAVTGAGIAELLQAIESQLSHHYLEKIITVPSADGKQIAWLHRHASVLREHQDGEFLTLGISIDETEYQKYLAQFEG